MQPNFDNVITDSSSVYATNTIADDAWKELGCSGQIPLEGNKGHWNEACLKNEVMTPTIFRGIRNPLSKITVAAMADRGYDVDYNGVDPYLINDLGSCGASCPEASSSGGRRLASSKRRQLEMGQMTMTVRAEFKDLLLDYHQVLQESGFVQGEGGWYVMEEVHVLVQDNDGHLHTVTVAYDDL